MSNLRKEYKEFKSNKDKIIEEAAYSWVEKNVVLINERINRKAVGRLTDAILKFDETFSPVAEKLPALKNVLDNAEIGLSMVLSGKTSDSRASDMLKRLSLTYSLLSDFFGADLPLLLKTPMFKAARENPDVRLDSISEGKHDPATIAKMFEEALRPSKDELKLMGKIYKNVPLPDLDATITAKQMLGLSFNELASLTNIQKVPMIATSPEAPKNSEENVSEPMPLEEQAEDVATKTKAVTDSLEMIKKSISASPALKSRLSPAIDKLNSEAIAALGGNDFKQWLASGKADIRNFVKSPTGKVMAQAETAISTFKALGQLQPVLDKLLNKEGELTDADVTNLKGILEKGVKGGMFSRLTSMFKTPPFPGLSPDDIINAVLEDAKTSEQEPQGQTQPQNQQPVTEGKVELRKTLSDLKTSLSSAAPGPLSSTSGQANTSTGTGPGSTQSKGSTPAGNPSQPAQQAQGTGNVTQPKAQAGGLIEVPDDASDEQLKAITAKVGVEPDRLRKLAQTRGIRLMVDPKFFQIK